VVIAQLNNFLALCGIHKVFAMFIRAYHWVDPTHILTLFLKTILTLLFKDRFNYVSPFVPRLCFSPFHLIILLPHSLVESTKWWFLFCIILHPSVQHKGIIHVVWHWFIHIKVHLSCLDAQCQSICRYHRTIYLFIWSSRIHF
jgi:hypothetical protein